MYHSILYVTTDYGGRQYQITKIIAYESQTYDANIKEITRP